MNNILKAILIITISLFSFNSVNASELSKLITSSPIDESSTVAVSVKEVETGKIVYQYNAKKLLHPASTLKVFTTFPALDVLGDQYMFTTSFYVANNNLYIKLGADPMLTSQNIKDVVKSIKSQGYKTFNNVYIDDSIIDNVEWGVGWMWDDGTNPMMPKFGAYNLDNNLTSVTVSKNANGSVSATPNSLCPLPYLNVVKSGNDNKVYAIRHDWISPEVVCLSGNVASSQMVQIPINNMQRYFESRVTNYLNRSNVKIANKTFLYSAVPSKAKKVATVEHGANALIGSVLKSSNNMHAEMLAKMAGGEKTKSKACLANQLQVFYDYWKNNNVDTSEIVVADASGVSRNDLLTVDFMTNALNKLYQVEGSNKLKAYLAQPGEGTLENRLLNYRGNLYLKTGTLSNISGLTGYVVAENGKTYSVAILIQNFVYPMSQVKNFENEIIENIIKL